MSNPETERATRAEAIRRLSETHVVVGDHPPEPREPYRLSDRVKTGVVRYDGRGSALDRSSSRDLYRDGHGFRDTWSR